MVKLHGTDVILNNYWSHKVSAIAVWLGDRQLVKTVAIQQNGDNHPLDIHPPGKASPGQSHSIPPHDLVNDVCVCVCFDTSNYYDDSIALYIDKNNFSLLHKRNITNERPWTSIPRTGAPQTIVLRTITPHPATWFAWTTFVYVFVSTLAITTLIIYEIKIK